MSKHSNSKSSDTFTVLHVSHSARSGGASLGAWNLHTGLRSAGVDSRMLVADTVGLGAEAGVYTYLERRSRLLWRVRKNLEIHPIRLRFPHLRGSGDLFSPAAFGAPLQGALKHHAPAIVHLHWVNFGTVSVDEIGKIPVPVVWTLRDMWPMTGGCHYSKGCERYTQKCGACPMLHSSKEEDVSSRLLSRKKKAWRDMNLIVVALSRWMERKVRASAIFQHRPICRIPTGVDAHRFRPVERAELRERNGLSAEGFYILFAAIDGVADHRKGFKYLRQALEKIGASELSSSMHAHLMVAGSEGYEIPRDLPCRVVPMGIIKDPEKMAEVYAMADLMVAPSVEENFPKSVLESMSCGTPVLAFDLGGMADLIEHKTNGFLSKPLDPSSLAEGIRWFHGRPDRSRELGIAARSLIERSFSIERQVDRHIQLYRSLLQ